MEHACLKSELKQISFRLVLERCISIGASKRHLLIHGSKRHLFVGFFYSAPPDFVLLGFFCARFPPWEANYYLCVNSVVVDSLWIMDNNLAHSLSLPAGSWWALFSLFLSLYLACFSDSDFSVDVCPCVHLCVSRPFFPLSRKKVCCHLLAGNGCGDAVATRFPHSMQP